MVLESYVSGRGGGPIQEAADQVNRVWFCDLSPMSQRGVFYHRRLFTWEEMEIKYKVGERHTSANEGKEGEKMGREEEK